MISKKVRKVVAVSFFLSLLLPTVILASTEMIRGTVRDGETGQPLKGVRVKIKGTKLVCRTDEQGKYVLINPPWGEQTLLVSLKGYKKRKIKNVVVFPDQTTTIDITLFRIKKRPHRRKTIVPAKPWGENRNGYQIWSLKWGNIEKLPVRELSEVVTLLPGVVRKDGDFHILGGRSDENGWSVDGVYVRLPMNGKLGMNVIPNSIDKVLFSTFSDVSSGFEMSGNIAALTRTGRSQYHLTGELISDDFWAVKSKKYEILGIKDLYSYGYDDYVLTFSGPVPLVKDLKFYFAAQRLYRASPATRFEGWKQDSLQVKALWGLDIETQWWSVVEDSLNLYADIPPGRLPGGGEVGNTISGNLTWNRKPFNLRIGGSYFWGRSQQGSNGDPLDLYVTPVRGRRYRSKNYSCYINFGHRVTPTFHYNLRLSTFYSGSQDGDPIWWDDIRKLGDPVFNSALVDTGVVKRFYYYLPLYEKVQCPGVPVASFNKLDQSYWGVRLDISKQFGKNFDLSMGGDFNYYTLRHYSIQTLKMLQGFSNAEKVKGTPQEISDYWIYRRYGSVQNYGYDIYGNKINKSRTYFSNIDGSLVPFDGHDSPPHPINASFYVQEIAKFNSMVVNGGIRFDLFDTGIEQLRDWREIKRDSTGFVSEENFVNRSPYTFISPRLGISFPLTDHSVFHVQIGKYVHMPKFNDLFESRHYFLDRLFAGYKDQFPNPNLKPEELTQYEIGWVYNFGKFSSFSVTAFSRTYSSLTRTGILETNIPGVSSVILTENGGWSTVKGLSLELYLYRTNGFALAANYTLSRANGTGSASDSHFEDALSQTENFLPVLVAPLDFDERHKGMIDLDICTKPKSGPRIFGKYLFANLGLNLLFTFHSGAHFTRIKNGDGFSEVFGYYVAQPIETPNSSTLPWFYQVDTKFGKSFYIGPINFNLYVWVINLLNTKSVTAVFRQTGRPDTDGWLEADTGKSQAEESRYGKEEYIRWYRALLTNCGTFGWQVPRQVRFGIKFEF